MEEDSSTYWICIFFSLKKIESVKTDHSEFEYQRGSLSPEKGGTFINRLVWYSIPAIIQYEII